MPNDLLYIADPADTSHSTKLVDMNDATPFGPGFYIADGSVDIGETIYNTDWITQEATAGRFQAFRSHEGREMHVRLFGRGTSVDDLTRRVRALNSALDTHGVLVWQPQTAAEATFHDFDPSPLVGLFRGQDFSIQKVVQQLIDPDGLVVTVQAQPYPRTATLLSSVNLLPNGLMLEDADKNGRPDGWQLSGTLAAAISQEKIDWNFGGYSFRSTATNGELFYDVTIPSVSGTQLVAAQLAALVSAAGGTTQLRVECYNGASLLTTITGSVVNPTTLTVLTALGSAPNGTNKLRFILRVNTTSGTPTFSVGQGQVEYGAAVTRFRAGTDVVTNSPVGVNGKHLFVYNPGTAPGLLRVRLKNPQTTDLLGVNLGIKGEEEGNIADWAARSVGVGLAGLPSTQIVNSSSAVADPGKATVGANVIKTTFASNLDSFLERWRWNLTPTDRTSLLGTWDVYASVRFDLDAVDPPKFRMGMKWGPANVDPLAYSEDTFTLESQDLAATHYITVKLGTITLDPSVDPAGLFIEGWAGRIRGAVGSLYWDAVWLQPASQQLFLSIPGFRTEGEAPTTWVPTELVSPAWAQGGKAGLSVFDDGSAAVLSETDDAVGIPPYTGIVLGPGRYRVWAYMNIINKQESEVLYGNLEILDLRSYVQNSTTRPIASFGKTTIRTGTKRDQIRKRVGVTFTIPAGSGIPVMPVVTYTRTNAGGQRINVTKLVLIKSGVIPAGTQLTMRGDIRRAYMEAGGNFLDALIPSGAWLEAPPGISVLTTDFYSVIPTSPLAGDYHTIDEREPVGAHVPQVTATLDFDLMPRWKGL